MNDTPIPAPLQAADIDPHFAESLTTQSYAKKPVIDGVRIADLRNLVDDGGSFAELVRLGEDGIVEAFAAEGFRPRQASFSVVSPGAIKAFHLHFKQDDIWFVPPADRMLVGLVDARAGSATRGNSQRIVLGAGRTQLLFIPRGVAHGVVNQASTPGTIFYFVNQQFNIGDPDEHRLPWDILGAEFWQMMPG